MLDKRTCIVRQPQAQRRVAQKLTDSRHPIGGRLGPQIVGAVCRVQSLHAVARGHNRQAARPWYECLEPRAPPAASAAPVRYTAGGKGARRARSRTTMRCHAGQRRQPARWRAADANKRTSFRVQGLIDEPAHGIGVWTKIEFSKEQEVGAGLQAAPKTDSCGIDPFGTTWTFVGTRGQAVIGIVMRDAGSCDSDVQRGPRSARVAPLLQRVSKARRPTLGAGTWPCGVATRLGVVRIVNAHCPAARAQIARQLEALSLQARTHHPSKNNPHRSPRRPVTTASAPVG